MTELHLSEEIVAGAIEHMNRDHQNSLLACARRLVGLPWARTATLMALDARGFDLLVGDGNGRQETHRIQFPQLVADAAALRMAFMQLADQADPADGIQRIATAHVATPKASRYLKALCNHFDRKANAHYDDTSGQIQFPFGECTLEVIDDALLIQVVSESETMFTRVKHVVADHLVRFAVKEELTVNWADTERQAVL